MRGMGSLGRNSWGGHPLKDLAISAILRKQTAPNFVILASDNPANLFTFLYSRWLNGGVYLKERAYSFSRTFHMFHTFHQSIPTPTHITKHSPQ